MDTQPMNALSQLLENMSVQDLLMVLKDTQMQNQALKNNIHALCTAPAPIGLVSGSPSTAPVTSAVPSGDEPPGSVHSEFHKITLNSYTQST
ncbi:hypothetical protein F5146DRAFT_1141985 [Armillaria mellea]|nr:hypothetical protein F5146DRAFT_1141985 [Armillaria mellea]